MIRTVSVDRLISAMSQPAFYPRRPDAVGIVQTHISVVFLAGDEVFKVKKPVRFSFLDFSTLERRRHYCHEEVRLNRRLAGGVYLGVVAIREAGNGFRLCDAASPDAVEYAVHMRRLPPGRTLDRLLDAGQATAAMIDRVARRLAAFHRDADRGPEVASNGSPAAIRQTLEDNYQNVRRFRGETIAAEDDDAIQAYSRNFLARHDSLFRTRQAEGRIRDGHGDLHSEHVCFARRLVIFDCIEFSTALRCCDVASEIAFLAMDLDYHGRPDLSERLVHRYAGHARDPGVLQLGPFYRCYRAYVRGKVDSLKSVESEVPAEERAASAQSARRHFALAYRYTWSGGVCVVAITGLSGSGKSTLAAALAGRTGFVTLSSDITRKRLAGFSPTSNQQSAIDTGLYTRARTAITYRTLLKNAAAQLDCARGVIIDATFQRRSDRDAVRALAAARGRPVLFVECRCDEELIRQRLAERSRSRPGPSDAGWEVYLLQRRRFEPFAADETGDWLCVDTSGEMAAPCRAIESALRWRVPL